MSDVSADESAPLPSRVTWFAPWRWFPRLQPWTRWSLVVAALLVGYVLSPILIVPAMNQWRGKLPAGLERTIQVTLSPLEFTYRKVGVVRAFYDTAFNGVRRLLQLPP